MKKKIQGFTNEVAEKTKDVFQAFFADVEASSNNNSKKLDKGRIQQLILGQNLGVQSQAFLQSFYSTLEKQNEKIIDGQIALYKTVESENISAAISSSDPSMAR